MKKALVFPLNEDTNNLIKNLTMCKDYIIKAVSSYREDKKRLEYIWKENDLFCSVDFEECLKIVDVVIFAENTKGHTYSGYKERVEKALKSGKDVIIAASLLEKLEIETSKKNIQILQKKELKEYVNIDKLRDISIPAISVIGEGENCDKFQLQIKLKRTIEKRGYNVLSICSNPMGKFLGMEILPGFLFLNTLSLPIKIKAFNLWIYKLQKQSKADIIILGCPSGIMQFNDFESNYFGEIPLIIHSAVVVDNSILTLYRNCYQNEDTMTKLSEFCSFKYDTTVENFVMSKQFYSPDYEQKKMNYYEYIENETSERPYEKSDRYNISLIENDVEIESQVDGILADLENNFFVI